MNNIKPKQWIRREDNTFSIPSQDFLNRLNREGIFENGYLHFRAEIIKVADTPQELIDINTDLICGVNENKPVSIDIKHDNCFQYGNSYIDFNSITKIYTPNSRGDYIKQYSLPIK